MEGGDLRSAVSTPCGVIAARTLAASVGALPAYRRRGNRTVIVIPFGGATFPGSGQPVVYAYSPVTQLDTVELDSDHGCEFLDAEAQLAKYRSVLDRMEASALDPDESRALITRISKSI